MVFLEFPSESTPIAPLKVLYPVEKAVAPAAESVILSVLEEVLIKLFGLKKKLEKEKYYRKKY